MNEITYTIKRTKRARRLSITVNLHGEVSVTLPRLMPEFYAKRFVDARKEWILKTQEKIRKHTENKIILKQSRKDYIENKEKARVFISERIKHFNAYYNFSFKDIRIKNQKSRWGSCSSKGNLNFNYALVHLPHDLADYIIVHELCHLKEMNHGRRFWNLVAETIPDHKARRAVLRKNYIQVQ